MPETENKTKEGTLYILTNLAMPGYIKIGKTTGSVDKRVKELSGSTASPLPFECVYATKVADMNKVERAFHYGFGDHRINPRREFFRIAPERVVAILKLFAIDEVNTSANAGVETKEDALALDVARKRRSAFNFQMVDIPAGAILTFIRDESITCVVAPDQKHVEFQGQVMSISSAAQKALGSKWQVQGPAYWMYEGELLDEHRLRFEDSIPSAEKIEEAGDRYMSEQYDISRGK